jgi:hydroxypyruvate reductase
VVRAALAAADAGRLVRQALTTAEIHGTLKSASAIDVVAVGKAARAMLVAASDAAAHLPLRHLLGVSPLPGVGLPPAAQWHTSAHPVPDSRSLVAGQAVLDVASAGHVDDLFVVLLSGGASALMAVPAEGISLQDKRRTSQRLLNEGAEVHALNTVRKHLSAIKGGQLAAAAHGAVLALAVSDVVGDDLSTIGSGPTVADATTFGEALGILDQHGGRDQYPAAVVARLMNGAAGGIAETPKPGDSRLARSKSFVIGGSRTAIDGARAAAERRGYNVHVIDAPLVGEAREAARELLDAASRVLRGRSGPQCILAAGETTVRVSGSGKGGRNQECALAMALGAGRLASAVAAASVGTDGVDGPTDAAGAMVDSTTLARAETLGIGTPMKYLDDNNSYAFFDALGDLIRTGPTDTNVGDLQIILVDTP